MGQCKQSQSSPCNSTYSVYSVIVTNIIPLLVGSNDHVDFWPCETPL